MLYSKTFINSIPYAGRWERRPLANLKANHPWLLHKLNSWYTELFPNEDKDIANRLMSVKYSEDFTAGFWELVILRYFSQINHEVLYHQEVKGKTPDLYFPAYNLIGDIVSISDPCFKNREYKFIDQLSQAINGLNVPFDIHIQSFHFSGKSYRKRAILKWIKSLSILDASNSQGNTHEYDDGESKLEVCVLARTKGPIVKSLGIFSLDDEQLKKVVKGRIENKLEKYRRPMIVFACSGLGFWNLQEETLDTVLYGDIQVTFSHDPKVRKNQGYQEARATNGLFHNRRKNGLPANDRLLAVIFVDRKTEGQKLYLRLKVFHNPYACPPLAQDFFGGHTQFIVLKDNGQEFTMGTVNEENKVIEVT